jgi:hypothetical protein
MNTADGLAAMRLQYFLKFGIREAGARLDQQATGYGYAVIRTYVGVWWRSWCGSRARERDGSGERAQ